MPLFKICKYDADYNAVVDWSHKEFKSKAEAEEYCKEKSWWRVEYYVQDGGTKSSPFCYQAG